MGGDDATFTAGGGTLLSNSTPCFLRRKTGTGTQVAGRYWGSPHGPTRLEEVALVAPGKLSAPENEHKRKIRS